MDRDFTYFLEIGSFQECQAIAKTYYMQKMEGSVPHMPWIEYYTSPRPQNINIYVDGVEFQISCCDSFHDFKKRVSDYFNRSLFLCFYGVKIYTLEFVVSGTNLSTIKPSAPEILWMNRVAAIPSSYLVDRMEVTIALLDVGVDPFDMTTKEFMVEYHLELKSGKTFTIKNPIIYFLLYGNFEAIDIIAGYGKYFSYLSKTIKYINSLKFPGINIKKDYNGHYRYV